jgi:lysozyme
MTAKCIDISHYQGRPDFNQVAASGVLAMIHKATEGTGYSDPDRAINCSNALKAGMAICTYHFLKHGNADAQMDFYVDVVEPVDGERLIIDYEDSACTIGDLHEAVQQLLDRGAGKNWQITVYSGNLLKEQLGNSHDDFLAKNTDLWLAQYTSGTPSWPKGTYPTYSLWQYSESGTIPGISGAYVDLNVFNGSDENLIKWIGPVDGLQPPVAAKEVNIVIAVKGNVKVTVNGQPISAVVV